MAVWYVDSDSSNTHNGDGTAPGHAASGGAVGAFSTLYANLGSIAAGDTVWLRRSGTAETATRSSTVIPSANVYGWPKSTDALYASRPTTGTSAWDSDSADYYVIDDGGDSDLTWGAVADTDDVQMLRIHVQWPNTGNDRTRAALAVSGQNKTLTTCKIEVDGSSTKGRGLAILGSAMAGPYTKNIVVNDCTVTRTSSANTLTAGSSGWRGLLVFENVHGVLVLNSTFTISNVDGCEDGAHGAVMVRADLCSEVTVRGCTFTGTQQVDRSNSSSNDDYAWFAFRYGARANFYDCTMENDHASNKAGGWVWLEDYYCTDNTQVAALHWERNKFINAAVSSFSGHCDLYDSTWRIPAGAAAFRLAQNDGITHGCTFVFRNCTFPAATDSHVRITANDCRATAAYHAFFDSCTTPSTLISSSQTHCIMSATTVGSGTLAGYYQSHGGSGYAATTGSVRRTGGEAFSIRCSQSGAGVLSVGDYTRPACYATLTAGASNTVTLYGVYAGHATAPSGNNLALYLAYRDAAGLLQLATTRGAALVADSGSTWTGAAGSVAFSQSVAVTLPAGTDQNCGVWYTYSKRVDANFAGEFLAFDPKVVVT